MHITYGSTLLSLSMGRVARPSVPDSNTSRAMERLIERLLTLKNSTQVFPELTGRLDEPGCGVGLSHY
jgi:hypothetical protein